MTKIGTTFTKSGKKAILCGSGELGKEVALELQRYGVEVVALDKYENAVVEGGKIFVDSSFIERKVVRTDVNAYYIPATKMAAEAGVPTLANMILLGKMLKETKVLDFEGLDGVFKKIVSAKRADLIDANLKALEIGYNYED